MPAAGMKQSRGKKDADGSKDHTQHIRGLPGFDKTLSRCFLSLSFLHHMHNASDRGVGHGFCHLHQNVAGTVDRAGEDFCPDGLSNLLALTRQR